MKKFLIALMMVLFFVTAGYTEDKTQEEVRLEEIKVLTNYHTELQKQIFANYQFVAGIIKSLEREKIDIIIKMEKSKKSAVIEKE